MSNKSKAQNDLYNSLMNPILANLMNPTSRTYNDVDAAKNGGLGWISIPTTANSGLDKTLSELNAKDSFMNFLVLKKYTTDECELIFNALNKGNPTVTDRPRLATGDNIIFDYQGNIAINTNGTNKILYNPTIPDKLRSNVNLDATSVNNTISGSITGGFMSQSKGNVYYISSKIVINPTLNYILYTEDAIPSSTSIYYLLYNPIHRESFQDYYRSLLESTGSWDDDDLLLYDPGESQGYQDSDIQLLDPELKAPSYKTIISKYCNAFKILGNVMANGQIAEHYADPSCNMALSKEDAVLAFILGSNYTQATLARKYWAVGDDDSSGTNGYLGFQAAKNVFAGVPQISNLYWPCKDQNPQLGATPYRFCAERSGVIKNNSTSFLTVLANAYVNSYGTTVTNVPRPLNRGARHNKKMSDCIQVNKNITNCQNIVNIGGYVETSNIPLSNACGVDNKIKRPVVSSQPERPVQPDEPDEPDDIPSSTQGMGIIITALIIIILLIIALIILKK